MTHNTFKILALLIAVACLPARAQEEPQPLDAQAEAPAEAAPAEAVADDTSAADAAPAEASATEPEAVTADGDVAQAGDGSEAATADASDPFAETPTVDTVPVDSFASGETDPFADPSAGSSGEGEEQKSSYYLAAGFDSIDFSASTPELQALFGGQDFSGMQVHLRGGLRVHEMVSLEVQGGAKAQNGVDPGTVQINNYLGLFVVPSSNLGWIEISAPIGFNSFRLIRGDSKEKFQRPSFGLSLALPVRAFKEALPDLRFTGGYKIYYVDKDARVYGYHAGMQYDFEM